MIREVVLATNEYHSQQEAEKTMGSSLPQEWQDRYLVVSEIVRYLHVIVC